MITSVPERASASAILTTVVGSYPLPEWLRAYPTRDHLRDATLVVVRAQELAGIDVVADGELSRFDVNHPETNGMIDYFTGQLDGVSARLTQADRAEFAGRTDMGYRVAPAGTVNGPIGPGTLDLAQPAALLRTLTTRRTKFTLTSPYMLSRVLLDRSYGDRQALAMAIGAVLRDQAALIDADIVQVDEASLTGHPEDGKWAAEAINQVLSGVRGQKAVHLCFGNYGGQTIQSGHYRKLIEFMNALDADHVVLECAHRDPQELEELRGLSSRLGVGLGVIDVKSLVIESADEVARRIERGAAIVGVERIRYVNPDCGLWMLPRSVADSKLRALVAGRDRFLGRA